MTHLEDAVRQPLIWSGVPRSEGGTVTATPGTELFSDPIYIGDAEVVSVELAVSNVSGATHVHAKYQESINYDPTTDTGDWNSTKTSVVADMTTDDTLLPFALSPIFTRYIRFSFIGAASNGAYNRIRGALLKQ